MGYKKFLIHLDLKQFPQLTLMELGDHFNYALDNLTITLDDKTVFVCKLYAND